MSSHIAMPANVIMKTLPEGVDTQWIIFSGLLIRGNVPEGNIASITPM